jgi:hypothetical protein
VPPSPSPSPSPSLSSPRALPSPAPYAHAGSVVEETRKSKSNVPAGVCGCIPDSKFSTATCVQQHVYSNMCTALYVQPKMHSNTY